MTASVKSSRTPVSPRRGRTRTEVLVTVVQPRLLTGLMAQFTILTSTVPGTVSKNHHDHFIGSSDLKGAPSKTL